MTKQKRAHNPVNRVFKASSPRLKTHRHSKETLAGPRSTGEDKAPSWGRLGLALCTCPRRHTHSDVARGLLSKCFSKPLDRETRTLPRSSVVCRAKLRAQGRAVAHPCVTGPPHPLVPQLASTVCGGSGAATKPGTRQVFTARHEDSHLSPSGPDTPGKPRSQFPSVNLPHGVKSILRDGLGGRQGHCACPSPDARAYRSLQGPAHSSLLSPQPWAAPSSRDCTSNHENHPLRCVRKDRTTY